MVSIVIGKKHCLREVQPNFERLWHDCLEEEGRIQSRNGGAKEGSLSLTAKTKKSYKFFHQKNKGKKLQGKHIDLSNIECFNCHKMGHDAIDCKKPKRKFRGKF